ncbi:MAG: hypothetical protein K6D94_07610 [Clostridiales bacterium]|nr:hypothetical protein [Clostridiales bacterium]
MIGFRNRLPAMNVNGRHNGTYNNEEGGCPCCYTVNDSRLGQFLHHLRNAVYDDRRLVFIDGKVLCCSNNWIRDHTHEMKAFRHWEYDLTSFLDFIIDTQQENGRYFELIKQLDDFHWKFVDESCRRIYEEDNVALVRLELEADIEYLVVEAAEMCFKATGDLGWLNRILPRLEKGIDYLTSDPKRWDPSLGLVIRPFTIDTWDFTYGKPGNNRRIEPGDPMAAMHGDSSGAYDAMRILASFRRLLGDSGKAAEWDGRAEDIRKAMIKHLWNGRFFIHQLHLNSGGADGLENERLSLSNVYDINRGVTDLSQSRSIISEYMRRGETTEAFAEWFTVDPPYPEFNGYGPGRYVNGAISPFTAGELARAAFENGYEEYGWDIISRFMDMMERDGNIYFVYSPDDGKPQGGGPSGWGAAALMSAVDEGLAGITDTDHGYGRLGFSPRFPVTGYDELRYVTGYEKSSAYVDVRYILVPEGMRYDIKSPASRVDAHIMLPKGRKPGSLLVNGEAAESKAVTVGDTVYADFSCQGKGDYSLELIFG